MLDCVHILMGLLIFNIQYLIDPSALLVAETPECEWDELLLSKEFLKNCNNMFHVPARMCETMVPEFPIKHLNILDPLRSDNNLGRSVSRGNLQQ